MTPSSALRRHRRSGDPRRSPTARPVAAALAAALAAGLLAGLAPAPSASAGGDTVRTRFVLLSGHPGDEDSDPTSRGVVVVPGTVLRLGRGLPAVGDAEARSRELAALGERLRRTLRLDDVQTLYTHEMSLAVDRREELPAPTATSPVRIEVTLQGYNAELATYRVRFREGRSTFADSVVSVEPRGRALVGGLDGEEAPYLFLVVEPVAGPSWVRTVDEGITPPRAIERPAPQYTADGRKQRIQGVVILRAVIDENGVVRDLEALKGLPAGLTDAAIEAVERWRFTPALDERGKPVTVQYHMTVNFRLDDDAPPKVPESPPG